MYHVSSLLVPLYSGKEACTENRHTNPHSKRQPIHFFNPLHQNYRYHPSCYFQSCCCCHSERYRGNRHSTSHLLANIRERAGSMPFLDNQYPSHHHTGARHAAKSLASSQAGLLLVETVICDGEERSNKQIKRRRGFVIILERKWNWYN